MLWRLFERAKSVASQAAVLGRGVVLGVSVARLIDRSAAFGRAGERGPAA
jgi:hypothetical protein